MSATWYRLGYRTAQAKPMQLFNLQQSAVLLIINAQIGHGSDDFYLRRQSRHYEQFEIDQLRNTGTERI